jgi:hypothetical protein
MANDLGLVTLTDETEDGEHLVFNPSVFEVDPVDVYEHLESLGSADRDEVMQLLLAC